MVAVLRRPGGSQRRPGADGIAWGAGVPVEQIVPSGTTAAAAAAALPDGCGLRARAACRMRWAVRSVAGRA